MTLVLIGLLIHLTAAVLLSLHVLDSRRSLYWLPTLLLVPLVASAIYFLAIYLPEVRFERRVRRLAAGPRRAAARQAPHLAAHEAYDEVPSLQNRLALAEALLESGDVEQALEHYEACLSGPFRDEPDVRLGAARAWLMSGRADQAAELLLQMRKERPAHYPEQASRLLAQAVGMTGQFEPAGRPCLGTVDRYGRTRALAAGSPR
jgi:hypothetical protein